MHAKCSEEMKHCSVAAAHTSSGLPTGTYTKAGSRCCRRLWRPGACRRKCAAGRRACRVTTEHKAGAQPALPCSVLVMACTFFAQCCLRRRLRLLYSGEALPCHFIACHRHACFGIFAVCKRHDEGATERQRTNLEENQFTPKLENILAACAEGGAQGVPSAAAGTL